ncbi:MAG TPA: TrbI F-type domain-containing protein [Candidatus Babeliales bacterium]|nr:TrbI F-type domain-containing protein [Candidatus Babeliales bacterium]
MNINSILKVDNDELRSNLFVYSSSFLFGVLGALMVFIVANFFVSPKPSIGTVNITSLVDRFIKEETIKNLPPETLKQEVKAFGRNLEKELKAFSAKNHLILLPTEAVIAGTHDYTALIRERLANQQSGNV